MEMTPLRVGLLLFVNEVPQLVLLSGFFQVHGGHEFLGESIRTGIRVVGGAGKGP
jgi:hypothetical protein